MLKHPAVAVAALLCGTVVALAVLGIAGWLLYAGKDAVAIFTFVNGILGAWILVKLRGVEKNTNGTNTRLLDVALKDKEQG